MQEQTETWAQLWTEPGLAGHDPDRAQRLWDNDERHNNTTHDDAFLRQIERHYEHLESWLPHLGPSRPCMEDVSITAAAADAAANHMATKASGADNRKTEVMLQLPPAWSERDTVLLNLMLTDKQVPTSWARCRAILIPKTGGTGYRPISIALVAWRM